MHQGYDFIEPEFQIRNLELEREHWENEVEKSLPRIFDNDMVFPVIRLMISRIKAYQLRINAIRQNMQRLK